MNTGDVINNKVNGYPLEEWKSFLESDLQGIPNKIRLLNKMKDKMSQSAFEDRLESYNLSAKQMQEDIDYINSILTA